MMNLEDDIKALANTFGEEYELPNTPTVIPLKPDDKTKPLTLPPSMLESMIKPNLPQTTTTSPAPANSPQTEIRIDNAVDSAVSSSKRDSKTSTGDSNMSQPIKRKRGRPPKQYKIDDKRKTFTGDNSNTDQSSAQFDERQLEKLSHDIGKRGKRNRELLPVVLDTSNQMRLRGKTSLTYLQIYGQLNRGQLEAVLNQKSEDLPLTIAEIAALNLLNEVISGDEKAKKLYWDLQKTLEKSKNTPVKPDKNASTLLEKALAESEEAILGEIVVDNPE